MSNFREKLAEAETQDQKANQSNQPKDDKKEDKGAEEQPAPQPTNSDPDAGKKVVKLDVIKSIKEIQSQLTSITFLDALSKVHTDNPIKKDVEALETGLSELRKSIEDFVTKNHFDSAERQADEVPEGNLPMSGDDESTDEDEEKAKEEVEKKKIELTGKNFKKDDDEAEDPKEEEAETADEEDKKKKKSDKKTIKESSFRELV